MVFATHAAPRCVTGRRLRVAVNAGSKNIKQQRVADYGVVLVISWRVSLILS